MTTEIRPVWDLATRLFHWLLAGTVGAALLIGYLAPAWWLGWHLVAGYLAGGLLILRLVWGWQGPEPSRFRSFWYPLSELGAHFQALWRRRPRHYLGHNPAGALMIFLLLGLLTALAGSGLMGLGGVEKQGPLAGWVPYALGRQALNLHAWLAGALTLAIGGHLAGVLLESLATGENLVRTMLDGRKRVPTGCPAPAPGRWRAALAILAGAGLLTGTSWWWLAQAPAIGVRPLALPALYRDECGACHWPQHPSLLPAARWSQIMAGLDDHFGDSASLAPEPARAISQFLTANGAETWDTEAAHELAPNSLDPAGRMTEGAFWRRRHQALSDADFARPPVGAKVNCPACHRDADQGLFADQAIQIP